MVLARALQPLLEGDPGGQVAAGEMHRIVKTEYPEFSRKALAEVRRSKLGLSQWTEESDELWSQLQDVMEASPADYTLLFRQLTHVTNDEAVQAGNSDRATDSDSSAAPRMFAKVLPALYCDPCPPKIRASWERWLVRYSKRLIADGRSDAERQAEMRASSPKYVPREWMLAEAYNAAEAQDTTVVERLAQLFARPYDEQPSHETKYYRRTPPQMHRKAGIAYFS